MVDNDAGDIVIQRGTTPLVRADVRARSTERAQSIKIQTVTLGDTTTVSLLWPEPTRNSDEYARLTLELPDAHDLNLTTRNGMIEVFHVGSAVTARGANGHIIINGVPGAVDAQTTNGRVVITDAGTRVRASTTNAEVRVSLTPENAGPVDIVTSNGRVVLSLPNDVSGTLMTRTSNGEVITGADMSIDLAGKDGVVHVGESSQPLGSIRTSNGNIRIERR